MRDWLLYEACLKAKASADLESDHAAVSISIAPGELEKDDFLESVRRALVATDLPPHHIELAFAETALVNMSPLVRERLGELCGWGVELAVRGFGARYGALTYLEKLNFATIRLDASFAWRLAAPLLNPYYPLAVIRGLLAVADELDITVVACSIETPETMRLFCTLGCNVQQGPLFNTSAVHEATGALTNSVRSKTGAVTGKFTN